MKIIITEEQFDSLFGEEPKVYTDKKKYKKALEEYNILNMLYDYYQKLKKYSGKCFNQEKKEDNLGRYDAHLIEVDSPLQVLTKKYGGYDLDFLLKSLRWNKFPNYRNTVITNPKYINTFKFLVGKFKKWNYWRVPGQVGGVDNGGFAGGTEGGYLCDCNCKDWDKEYGSGDRVHYFPVVQKPIKPIYEEPKVVPVKPVPVVNPVKPTPPTPNKEAPIPPKPSKIPSNADPVYYYNSWGNNSIIGHMIGRKFRKYKPTDEYYYALKDFAKKILNDDAALTEYLRSLYGAYFDGFYD